MFKSWEKVRDLFPMAAILLLCMLVMPATQAYADTDTNNQPATTTVDQAQAQPTAEKEPATKAAKKPATAKPSDKSVLDAEVLESPIAYFRNAFSSEEEETDTVTGTNVVVVTIKALIATLLSTVM